MFLVLLLYFLSATTFALGKITLEFFKPVLLIGLRMTVSGIILLAFERWYKKNKIAISFQDYIPFLGIIFFHILLSYIPEFFALQYVGAAKACFMYNLSPFITALLIYLFFGKALSFTKFIGLCIGFIGYLPVIFSKSTNGSLFAVSIPEVWLLVSVSSASLGWIIMEHLVVTRKYRPTFVNGIGMFAGGLISLFLVHFLDGTPAFLIPSGACLETYAIGFGYLLLLTFIANIVCLNLYGYLLNSYSSTFLSFAGLTSPLFASMIDLLIFNQPLNLKEMISFVIVSIGLLIFYMDDFYKKDTKNKSDQKEINYLSE